MTRLLKWSLSLLLILVLPSCSKFGPDQEKVWDLIDKGALIINVRSKEEFDTKHFDYAINIEYENIQQLVDIIGQDINRSVVLYCRSGRRASISMVELNKLGYNSIFNAHALDKMLNALEHKQNVNLR